MAKAKAATEAPYDADGNLLHYPGYGVIEWRPVVPFQARLQLLGYTRGRSAAYFELADAETGRLYPMFLKDFTELVLDRANLGGKFLLSNYTVQKRGQNYGIRLARPDETPPPR